LGEIKNKYEIIRSLKTKIYELDEIEKFEKKKNDAIWNKIKADMKPSRKYVYVIVAATLAIPTSLFAADNFVGSSSVNYLLVFITGFSIYRIQNIKDIFK
ncbi:MAG: hypothetical protein KC483_00735, partial [Nitrosarchaeum sp.]|nr:hypothetical protein [Nitrosarchaeum sp.]